MKILKIPCSCGALRKKAGIEKAPDAICKELENFYLKENGLLPILDIDEVKIENSNIEAANKSIQKKIKELNIPAIVIGGDHSITYSCFKSFANNFNNPGLVVFDAHADCENDFRPPTHEDYLRVLVQEGILKSENIILIGIRNLHINELEFVKKNKIKYYSMKELTENGRQDNAEAIMSVARKFDALYISVDIDVVDPAFAPGTGYVEPGGMSSRELIFLLHKLRLLRNFRMMDIVEVNPDKDISNLTVKLAAKLVVEMS
ncbi:arginase family protein [Candidatus Woesearchaeota archaeon]|nr:arginase family protein [Candidatus Woesearchaeota archaeon]